MEIEAIPKPTAQPRKPKICSLMRPRLSDRPMAKMMPTMSSDVVSAAAWAEWMPLAIRSAGLRILSGPLPRAAAIRVGVKTPMP